LKPARVHEVCGPAAWVFAAIHCGAGKGPALWILESWQRERINPAGLKKFCDPGKVLIAEAKAPVDVRALAEEALRPGAVATVVAESSQPLDLTAGRRLQLAAKAGGTLGICVIPEGMGSNAAETRWRCQPQFDPSDSTHMRWELIKNKSGTLGIWTLRWDEQAHRIAVVSEAGK
nr:hypothetical protein [Xanthomonadales bacterium]